MPWWECSCDQSSDNSYRRQPKWEENRPHNPRESYPQHHCVKRRYDPASPVGVSWANADRATRLNHLDYLNSLKETSDPRQDSILAQMDMEDLMRMQSPRCAPPLSIPEIHATAGRQTTWEEPAQSASSESICRCRMIRARAIPELTDAGPTALVSASGLPISVPPSTTISPEVVDEVMTEEVKIESPKVEGLIGQMAFGALQAAQSTRQTVLPQLEALKFQEGNLEAQSSHLASRILAIENHLRAACLEQNLPQIKTTQENLARVDVLIQNFLQLVQMHEAGLTNLQAGLSQESEQHSQNLKDLGDQFDRLQDQQEALAVSCNDKLKKMSGEVREVQVQIGTLQSEFTGIQSKIGPDFQKFPEKMRNLSAQVKTLTGITEALGNNTLNTPQLSTRVEQQQAEITKMTTLLTDVQRQLRGWVPSTQDGGGPEDLRLRLRVVESALETHGRTLSERPNSLLTAQYEQQILLLQQQNAQQQQLIQQREQSQLLQQRSFDELRQQFSDNLSEQSLLRQEMTLLRGDCLNTQHAYEVILEKFQEAAVQRSSRLAGGGGSFFTPRASAATANHEPIFSEKATGAAREFGSSSSF